MSMSTEQALAYLNESKNDTASEPEVTETTPSVEPEKEDSKSEVKDVASPEDTADKTNDGEPKSEVDTKADNPGTAKDDKVEKKDERQAQRDYAFIREKNKRKQQKERYEARIKELEAELKKRDNLEAKHFQKEDGTPDPEAYVHNEFAKRDMKDELNRIRQQDMYEQQQLEIEQDRIITERCFEGKDLDDYRSLISTKGPAFAAALKENDPNNVVLSYLYTLQEYPVVVRELMTNLGTLRRLFRSRDPEALKYNVRVIADEILEKHHAAPSQNTVPQTDVVEKKSIPVIGKQISSQSNTNSANASLVKDWNSINAYLAKHKYR